MTVAGQVLQENLATSDMVKLRPLINSAHHQTPPITLTFRSIPCRLTPPARFNSTHSPPDYPRHAAGGCGRWNRNSSITQYFLPRPQVSKFPPLPSEGFLRTVLGALRKEIILCTCPVKTEHFIWRENPKAALLSFSSPPPLSTPHFACDQGKSSNPASDLALLLLFLPCPIFQTLGVLHLPSHSLRIRLSYLTLNSVRLLPYPRDSILLRSFP